MALNKNWKGSWGQDDKQRPPADNAGELVDYLLDVGVLRARSSGQKKDSALNASRTPKRFEGQIDVPDLYLAGMGMKRKGGVKRR